VSVGSDGIPVIIGIGEIKDRPADPSAGLEPMALMAEADGRRGPAPMLVDDRTDEATVETHTVVFGTGAPPISAPWCCACRMVHAPWPGCRPTIPRRWRF
jgi:hypothetical protein